MASVSLETVGRRIYVVNSPFSAKDQLKSAGCKWDTDRRQWWAGSSTRSKLEPIIAELNGVGHSASVATEGSMEVAESLGLDKETPAGIVADKLRESGREKEADNIARGKSAQEDPHSIRLTGKGRYKGREYYAGAISGDGKRVRLLTLPDASGKYLDFWAPCADVEQTKKYQPREKWDGRRYSGRTVTVYTTLGSIADFVRKQKDPDRTKRVQCPECDAWHDDGEPCRECGGC